MSAHRHAIRPTSQRAAAKRFHAVYHGRRIPISRSRPPCSRKSWISQAPACCELGIPYSDPIADGPVIQASYTRALAKKIKLAGILEMLCRRDDAACVAGCASRSSRCGQLRDRPCAMAWRRCRRRAHKRAGAAGAIVPDLLVEEAGEFCPESAARPISASCSSSRPPRPATAPLQIAASSTGFLYYVSVTGITGERTELPQSLIDNVGWLREQTPLPICIGFGISQPEHVRRLAPVADGLIVGSAIVRRIAAADNKPRDQVLKEVGSYVASLLAALRLSQIGSPVHSRRHASTKVHTPKV